jgi:hypothetical protein
MPGALRNDTDFARQQFEYLAARCAARSMGAVERSETPPILTGAWWHNRWPSVNAVGAALRVIRISICRRDSVAGGSKNRPLTRKTPQAEAALDG